MQQHNHSEQGKGHNVKLSYVVPTLMIGLLASCGNPQSVIPTTNRVGFVGCSLTMIAVNGTNSSKYWPTDNAGYAGGGLSVWSAQLKDNNTNPDSYWAKFKSMLQAYPNPEVIWWELCPNSEAPNVTIDDTRAVLAEIRRLAPTAQVYASGVPIYPLDGEHCTINTDAGSQATLDLTSQLVADGELLQGPIMTVLTVSEVNQSDGCHANSAGEAIWGQNLVDVFGK